MELLFNEQLLKTQLEIQEQTLKTISQEIHDNIGQGLTLAKLNISISLNDDILRERLVTSKELITKAIADLRDLSHSMDTDYVQEMGLQRAIEYELERIQKSGAVSAVMEVLGSSIKLSKQKELILFRIVQEAFNNTLKHAEAETIRVLINYLPGNFTLTISDDGKGMEILPEQNDNAGLGTRNMRSRAKMIGAAISFESAPGTGTCITIILPLENNIQHAEE